MCMPRMLGSPRELCACTVHFKAIFTPASWYSEENTRNQCFSVDTQLVVQHIEYTVWVGGGVFVCGGGGVCGVCVGGCVGVGGVSACCKSL